MRIFITGGTGLLGNNLVRLALERSYQVTALVRSETRPASLLDLDVDFVQGDLSSAAVLNRAVAHCDAIIHSAAHIHIGWKHLEQAMSINRDGTQAMVDAAIQYGKPLVHVSTVNTLAIGSRHFPSNESTQYDGQVACTYVSSKRASEQIVRQAMAKGHQAAIVHPGFMLGPWDWKPSSGRMILEVAKRWTPLAPAGGCSVCDVRDVAQGVLAVLERSAFGRQFILAGDNLTYFDLWNRFAKALGKTGPLTTLRLPGQWLAGLFGDTISRFMSQESDLNSAAIRMSSQYHWYSSQKAMRELDYQPRPAQEAIRAAIDWFQQRRYL